MDNNRPSPSELLTDLGGWAFMLGVLTMTLAPFALPALVFGLLLLPLLLPVLLIALLYGMVALPRRYLAARGTRPSRRVQAKKLVTRSSYS